MKNKFMSKKLENLTKELELANQTRKEAIKDLTVSEEELQEMLDKINELDAAISEEVIRIAAKAAKAEEEELEEEEGEQMKFTQVIENQATYSKTVIYNRSAIMREGWKLKKDGIKEGISIAWKIAKEEKARIESEIEHEEMLVLEEMIIEEEAKIEERIREEEFHQQIWEDAEIDPNLITESTIEYTMYEEETDTLLLTLEMESQNEKEKLNQLEKMKTEDLYKMAKDLKGKHTDLETLIARAIIRKKRNEVA